MSLLGRIIVVLFAFGIACLAAGATAMFCFAVVLDDVRLVLDHGAGWIVIGLYGIAAWSFAFFPATLVLVVAEALAVRTFLFYAAAGALGMVGWYLGFHHEPMHGLTVRRELEILAASGIAGGLVYWLIAGRNAGRWRSAAS